MLKSAKYPLRIPRHQPFTLVVGIAGDFTGSIFSFEFRENPEDALPLIDLGNAALPADGIAAALTEVEGEDFTEITISIGKATLESIDQPWPLGSELCGWYGFKIDGLEYFGGEGAIAAQANHD